MALSIVAAKDIEQAFEILSASPRKAVKDHLAEEPEEVGKFIYDFRAAFTNYECYYRFDPYRDILSGNRSGFGRQSFFGFSHKVACGTRRRRKQRDSAIWNVLPQNPAFCS